VQVTAENVMEVDAEEVEVDAVEVDVVEVEVDAVEVDVVEVDAEEVDAEEVDADAVEVDAVEVNADAVEVNADAVETNAVETNAVEVNAGWKDVADAVVAQATRQQVSMTMDQIVNKITDENIRKSIKDIISEKTKFPYDYAVQFLDDTVLKNECKEHILDCVRNLSLTHYILSKIL
jgi:hypothetical protein